MISSDVKVWVEKYRPSSLDTMVLDDINKTILTNILETGNFPNLMLYGPPGTGKTTAIINLIHSYQEKWNPSQKRNKELVIHLNASDERGIDVIRNQIISFVEAKPLFRPGKKFVVLDEVDYMTKNAQQALRYLLQCYTNSRFCLICNYMSKIDMGLQTEFVLLRFNQLPKESIGSFLETICLKENLNITPAQIGKIQQMFYSDIRSMINYLQTNQVSFQFDSTKNNFYNNINSVNSNLVLLQQFKETKNSAEFINNIIEISKAQETDVKTVLKNILNTIIRNPSIFLFSENNLMHFFTVIENIMHNPSISFIIQLSYFVTNLKEII